MKKSIKINVKKSSKALSDETQAAIYITILKKIETLISDNNYFAKNKFVIVRTMESVIIRIIKKGYPSDLDNIIKLADYLFYLPMIIDDYYTELIGKNNLRKSNPFLDQIWFPKAVDLLLTKPNKNRLAKYPYKNVLIDAFNQLKRNTAYHIQNVIWFTDAEKLIEKDINKLVDRFEKHIKKLPIEIQKKIKVS